MLKRLGVALLAVAMLTSYAAWAADEAPATAPASAPAATGPAGRSDDVVRKDLMASFGELHTLMPDTKKLLDPAARQVLAPKLTPALHKVLDLLAEVGKAHPENAADLRDAQNQMLVFLDVLGDADAAKTLATAAASKDAEEAIAGKSAQGLAAWLKASKDAAAQTKVLDDMQALAKANPTNDTMAKMLMTMSNFGPASPENAKRAAAIVATDLKGELAKAIVAQKAESDAAEGKMKALENQPLAIEGKTVEGKAFTTADWKGKVILVDFWATWCGPCRAELPRVKKMYKMYHEKGLEVLGVSNDQTADALTGFIKEDGEMPWAQLFDAAAAADGKWNSNTTRFGINGIPVMFLIDRKGVLRSTEAREDFEEQIPKLLDEAAGSAPATPPA